MKGEYNCDHFATYGKFHKILHIRCKVFFYEIRPWPNETAKEAPENTGKKNLLLFQINPQTL